MSGFIDTLLFKTALSVDPPLFVNDLIYNCSFLEETLGEHTIDDEEGLCLSISTNKLRGFNEKICLFCDPFVNGTTSLKDLLIPVEYKPCVSQDNPFMCFKRDDPSYIECSPTNLFTNDNDIECVNYDESLFWQSRLLLTATIVTILFSLFPMRRGFYLALTPILIYALLIYIIALLDGIIVDDSVFINIIVLIGALASYTIYSLGYTARELKIFTYIKVYDVKLEKPVKKLILNLLTIYYFKTKILSFRWDLTAEGKLNK